MNINNSECLFWKVFHNKYLFNIIQQFKIGTSTFRYGRYKYQEITNIEWIIRNKHYSLLKEKIMSGDQNLSFSLSHNCYFNNVLNYAPQSLYTDYENYKKKDNIQTNYTYSIFNIDQPLKSDVEFYKSLFKNYGFFSSGCPKDLVTSLIDYDNPTALNIIINEYKLHKPTLDNLITSIQLNSFNVANYLINYLYTDKKKQFETPSKIWKLIFNQLGKKDYHSSKVDEIIQYLIYKGPLKFEITSVPKEMGKMKYKIDYLFYKEPLQTLINSCISIAILNISQSVTDIYREEFEKTNNENNQLFNQHGYNPLSLSELQEIKNQFTSNQLSTVLKEHQICSNIEKLIKMALTFSIGNGSVMTNHFCSMYYSKEDVIGQKRKTFNFDENERKFFFKNGFGNKQFQINYLNQFIEAAKPNLTNLLHSLVTLDVELYLIDIVLQEIENKSLNSVIFKISLNPVSVKMLDHLLRVDYITINIKPLLESKESPIIILGFYRESSPTLSIRNINLLNHFLNTYPEQFKISLKNYGMNILNLTNQSIEFISSNHHHFINHLKPEIKNICSSTLHKTTFEEKEIESIYSDSNKLTFIISTRSNGSLSSYNNEISPLYNYFQDDGSDRSGIGSIDKLQIIDNHLLLNEITLRGDLNSIDYICCNYSKDFKNKRMFKILFNYSIIHGRLDIFKFIHEKYPGLLIPLQEYSSKPTSVRFKFTKLNKFVEFAINCGQHHILLFFSNTLKYKVNFKIKYKSI